MLTIVCVCVCPKALTRSNMISCTSSIRTETNNATIRERIRVCLYSSSCRVRIPISMGSFAVEHNRADATSKWPKPVEIHCQSCSSNRPTQRRLVSIDCTNFE
jgi:hypothetical protein